MIYLPPSDKRQTSLAMFAALAASAAFYLTGNLGVPPLWLWQLLTVAALAFAILVITRYSFCQYKYILQDDDLIVVKLQGKKEQRVCLLSMEHAKKLLTEEEFKANRGKCRCFNYHQNISPLSSVRLFFDDGRDSLILLLEPDERFLAALKEQIP